VLCAGDKGKTGRGGCKGALRASGEVLSRSGLDLDLSAAAMKRASKSTTRAIDKAIGAISTWQVIAEGSGLLQGADM
jgi:hypothetical protein